MKRMAEFLLTGILLTTAVSATAVLDPRDPLLRWLDAEVVPELGEHLSRHPDFRHAVIGFLPLADGAAGAEASRLHAALEQHLRQRLLSFAGIQFHLDAAPAACAAPQVIDYAIGIDIARGPGRDARITVALLDLERRVWVSGTSRTWQGRLTDAQTRADEQLTGRAVPGSASAPFAMADTAALVSALLDQLQCVLPRGVDGAVYLETPAEPEARRIALELRRRLLPMPLFVQSDRESDATWILRSKLDPAAAGMRELSVELVARDGSGHQRLASAFVSGSGAAPPATIAVPRRRPDAPLSTRSLLSPLAVSRAERRGVCNTRNGSTCAEVHFELSEPAHLLVFSTRDEIASLSQCDARQLEREPGEYRFRLQIGRSASPRRPATGFYALAVRDRDAALELHRIVTSAPGACGTPAAAEREAWIARLAAALARHGDAVHWQAIHLDAEARPL